MATPGQLAAWTDGEWTRHPDEEIAGVSHDTRTLEPGDLYVALRGDIHDGHRFIPQALQAGAAALLVDEAPAVVGVPALVVDDTLVALQQWAKAHRARFNGPVIGVTGSAGKTTVKELLASVLEQAGAVCRTPGNWNNHIGVPLSLLNLRSEHAFGVFEAGMNHPGELDPLFELIGPDHGILTAIGAAHIEAFEDEAGIAMEKAALLRAVPESGVVVIDGESPWLSLLHQQARGALELTALSEGTAAGKARTAQATSPQKDVWQIDGWSGPLALPVPGRAMAENVLKVVVLAERLGLDEAAIRAGLTAWKPAAMRWAVEAVDGVTVINDAYNANPLSMQAALESFALLEVAGNRWLVLGSMQELGVDAEEAHRRLGETVGSGPWAGVVLMGEWQQALQAGMVSAAFPGKIVAAASHEEAATALMERTTQGDAVLLKASRLDRLETVLSVFRCQKNENGERL